jgi:uroporphyrinogen decarboxylase
MMTNKEAILTAYAGGVPDRVPVTIFGGGMWTILHAGSTFAEFYKDPDKMASELIRTNEELDMDIIYCGSGYNNFHAAALGGKIKYRQDAPPDLEVPVVQSADELKNLSIGDLYKNDVIDSIYKCTRRVAAELGDKVVVTMTTWGPFTLAGQIYGLEKLMRALFKKPEECHAIIEYAMEIIWMLYEPLLDDGTIEVCSVSDATSSGDLISAPHFKTYGLPYLQELSDRIHAKGGKVLLHICGDTRKKLSEIGETRVDCISLDQKVDIAVGKEVLKDRMCIGGNVAPVHVLQQKTPQEVEAACLDCIEKAAPDGGYVLMSGCDIPPQVPLENLKVFVRTAKGWKY